VLGTSFKNIGFHSVLSSTAERAKRTATIALRERPDLRPLLLSPSHHPELEEIYQGEFEGRMRREVYTPAVLERMEKEGYRFAAPGGESQQEVENRAVKLIEDRVLAPFLADAASDPRLERTVAVFSHGLTLRCWTRWAFRMDTANVFLHTLDNTGIVDVCYIASRGKWQLRRFNDTAHLAALIPAPEKHHS